ncbi:hypothetical protein [Microlunatus flavus]|uniref:Uncharacterized protein n=1 Tax=Microlunatus flavus TaxID=1036181 RepID=A0A1H9A0G7_9ACTN|nr:hypothetical protein [Microlunatus flavus]SEP70236.1 hypothetical protein SAMN05421756_101432 [Microlunatus flavus]
MSAPQGQGSSPYVVGPSSSPSSSEPSWGRVVARVLLVVVPSQLVGVLLAGIVIPFRVLSDHPGLGWLTYLFVAVVAGVALGLLLHPSRARLVGHAVVSFVVSAAVLVLLMVVGSARAGGGGDYPLARVGLGVLGTALLQTALAVLLWRRRTGRATRA